MKLQAQDTDKKQVLVNVVTNIRLPYKTRYFLIVFENSRSTIRGFHQLQKK